MENKDFRNRLKNHTSESNADAWEQMSQMLDSLPKQNEPKKKLLWLWLLPMVLCLIAPAYWMFSDSQSNTSAAIASKRNDTSAPQSTLQVSDQKTEVTNEKRIADQQATSTTAQENNSTSTNSLALNSKPQERSSSRAHYSTKESINSNNSDVSDIKDKSVETTSDQSNINSTNAISNATRDVAESEVAPSKTDISLQNNNDEGSQSEDTNNTSSSATTIIETFEKNLIGDLDTKENLNQNSNKSESRASINIDHLERMFMTIQDSDEEKVTAPQININTPSKFWYSISGGYAKFNNNPGFILMGSVKYELDKILEFEGAIAYSYGSDQSQKVGDEFEFENQIDFNLNAHLNFIKNSKYKFAFIGGLGFTKYAGQRVINIPSEFNFRASTGLNFTVGIDAQYNLARNTAIGLRAGSISYDDAVTFIAPYFINRF